MRELQVFDCQSDSESCEMFDKECLRLEHGTSIDPKDQRRYELVGKAAIHRPTCSHTWTRSQKADTRSWASTEPERLRVTQSCRSVK